MNWRKSISWVLAILVIVQSMSFFAKPDRAEAAISGKFVQPNGIAAGSNYTLFVRNDGKVITVGYGNNYELGTNSTYITAPQEIPNLDNVVSVASGGTSSYALINDGTVKSWGYGGSYQLGFPDTSTRYTPTTIPGLSNVVQIMAGNGFAAALLSDGTVKIWGNNGYGQLGLGTTYTATSPTLVPGLTDVKQIAAGNNFMLALLNDGTVRSWGYNGNGQLGLGHNAMSMTPTLVPGLTDVMQVATGSYHSLAVLNDGTVRTWGSNVYGELGLGNTTAMNTPSVVPGLTGVTQITGGNYNSIATLSNGTVKTWGYNYYGQAGTGNTSTSYTPITLASESNIKYAVTSMYNSFSFLVSSNYSVKAMGYNSYYQLGLSDSTNRLVPTLVPNLQLIGVPLQMEVLDADRLNTMNVYAGFSSYHASLYAGGTLKTWGYNNYGQLGIGDTLNRSTPVNVSGIGNVRQIVEGAYFTAVLLEDGTVKSWGYNAYGQLGLGDTTNRTAPAVVTGLSGVKQLAAGTSFALALMQDGSVKSWGFNGYGQAGINDTTSRYSPTAIELSGVKQIAAGGNFSLALMQDGTVKAWGYNTNGQLGLGDTTSRLVPTNIPGLTSVSQIYAGESSVYAILADGTVKVWGYNVYGQLGLGDTANRLNPTTLSGLTSVAQIAAGNYYALAVLMDGSMKGWGDNFSGQLGLGHTTQQLSPVSIPNVGNVKQAVAGYNFSVAVTTDGQIKSWGDNGYGQLGLGDTSSRKNPVKIAIDGTVKQMLATGNSSYTLLSDGSIRVWGLNSDGQLGLGDTTNRLSPTTITGIANVKQFAASSSHVLALLSDGTVKAWGNNSYGQLGVGDTTSRLSPIQISGLSNVKAVAAGTNFSVALLSDGTVKTWGYNASGQLGLGDTTNRNVPVVMTGMIGVQQIFAGGSIAFAWMGDGTIKGWGSNESGQLGVGDTSVRTSPTVIAGLNDVKQLAIGSNYTMALAYDGTVKVWGYNGSYQLGISDGLQRTTPTVLTNLSNVKQLAAGNSHSFAILDDGSVKGWGFNVYGQLGFGDTTTKSIPTTVLSLSDVAQIDAGASHTLALLNNGTIQEWGYDYSGNRLSPEVVKFTERIVAPSVRLSGTVGTTVSVSYYVDNEQIPRETRNVKLTGSVDQINFERFDAGQLSDGAHTLKFQVSDGLQKLTKTQSYSVDNVSKQRKYEITPTASSIQVTATTADSSVPIRITINTSVSSWYNNQATYTISGFSPNQKIPVKLEYKIADGTIASESLTTYTLAAIPTLSTSLLSTSSVQLTLSDTNPTNTEYQILVGNKSLTSDGKLGSGDVWITIPSKKITITGLTAMKSYKIQIKTRNQDGVESGPLITTISTGTSAAPPAAPKNVKAKPAVSSVIVSWQPVSDATGYQIEVDGNATLVDVGSNLSYVHSGLTANTVHTYRVRAMNGTITGAMSGLVTARTLIAVPIAPTSITATSTARTATIQWGSVTGAVGYEVEWDGEIQNNGNLLSFKAVDLLPGSQHVYRIRAFNAGGNGVWTALKSITTTTSAPSVPGGLAGEASDKKVNLTWNAVPDAVYYEVEADGIVYNNSNANFSEMTSLIPGSTHQYRIRSANEIGTSAWSTVLSLTTNQLPTPSGVIDYVQDTSIQLVWTPVEGASSYTVEFDGVATSGLGSPAFTKNSLLPETTHTYRVRAQGNAGFSGWSKTVSTKTLPAKPAAPSGVNALAGNNYITISWSSVSGVASYDIEIDGLAVIDNFNSTTYTDAMLDPFSPHTYRVRSKTDAVVGDWTAVIAMRTLPESPGLPAHVVITSAGSIATVKWDVDPTAIGYDIEVDGQVIDLGLKNEYQHRRLAAGSEHKYRVRVRNQAGTGAWTGLIINNALTARLTKANTVDLGLVAKDVIDFSHYTLKVTYDANAIDIIDLSTLTGAPELTTGPIQGTDIVVTEFKPGEITFTTNKVVNPGESWSGVINSIKMKAKYTGGSSLSYTVYING
ncbi:hypothetical protein H8B09_15790 [Paenibacillus sp. PR3]|uniref:Fibronectin type-III domain-containing protein n=1 Tax=Paenibacillus terricola TaxID=2763503 RepID=A0ABR8MW82_9BACL|nr:hypothetical protein [Paenibacillus terricola]MBD3920228.1 hypothetical protein [Paenibacillus terricola]